MLSNIAYRLKQPNYDLVKQYLDRNDTKFDFKCMDSRWNRYNNALQRELEYKAASSKSDPDCSELNMSIQCILLMANNIGVRGYFERYIVLEDDTILETDTIHSFLSIYKGALMTTIPNYQNLCKELGIKGAFSKELRKIIDSKEFLLPDENLLNSFTEFAALVHSLGNFNIGPLYFNCKSKYSKAKMVSPKNWVEFDRIDLFLKRVTLNPDLSEWLSWFSRNIYTTYLAWNSTSCIDGYFNEIKATTDGWVDLAQSELKNLGIDNGINSRIELTNNLIINRGKQMMNVLFNSVH